MAALPALKDVLRRLTAQAVRWTRHGTHTGDYIGVPATGRRIEHHAMVNFRGEQGRIVERSGVTDLGPLRQLGVAPEGAVR